MKIKTFFFVGGASLSEPVATEKISTETYPEYGTRHGGEVVTASTSRPTTNHLRSTITFQDEDVIQVNTWRGKHDPNETHAEHVDRHVALVVQILGTWQ